ncbi:MAG: tryptophan-rich sensory protein [Alphaproteobacteria bacterium]|nr:tryptophan-rich sensory protein [Alphaproteobacteria bacterium]
MEITNDNSHAASTSYKGLMGAIIGVLLLSWVASIPVTGNMEWYSQLLKPDYTPPSWTFGVVWPILYIMMTVAAWLVYNMRAIKSESVEEALAVFCFQLIINLLWTPFFFGTQSPWLGLMWIGLMWFVVGLTIVAFFSVRPLAGWLFIPYFAWVSYAFILNYSIWTLNGG